jgi:hypothetical protein
MPTTKHILESMLHDVDAMRLHGADLPALYIQGHDNALTSIERRIQRTLDRLETSEGR